MQRVLKLIEAGIPFHYDGRQIHPLTGGETTAATSDIVFVDILSRPSARDLASHASEAKKAGAKIMYAVYFGQSDAILTVGVKNNNKPDVQSLKGYQAPGTLGKILQSLNSNHFGVEDQMSLPASARDFEELWEDQVYH